MIADVEDYFTLGCGRCERFATPDCSTRKWSKGLKALRRICRAVGLVEALKWGHPCYIHAGRNIAIIGAFRADFRLSFMNAALMTDPEGLLVKQGENSRHPNMIRFTTNEQVLELETVVRAYLKEAMGYAEAGTKPAKDVRPIDLPNELVDAMDSDPELAEAFNALTPGRQRSYVIQLNSAKTPSTRVSRIAKYRDRILSGKGPAER